MQSTEEVERKGTCLEEASTGLEACLRAPSSAFPLALVLACVLEVEDAAGEGDALAEAADVLPFMEAAAADILHGERGNEVRR